MTRRPATSLMASPILIGAVTSLVTVIAVFLSYNANEGLPFVPTYNLKADVPNAAGLVKGNDVRIGGKRVGVITTISAKPGNPPTAQLQLKLDKTAEPLYSGSQVTVRPRSPLGLKYLEVVPLKTGTPLPPGGTLPIASARPSVDLDQLLGALDAPTRRSLQVAVSGLGTGFAGRGADFNQTLAASPELLRHAQNVARNLADPGTGLDGFVRGASAAASQVAPVAPQLGTLMASSSATAGALASVLPQLQDTISQLPATEDMGTRTLMVARPVLRNARLLVHDIRPGIDALTPAAVRLHAAIQTGIPVVRHALALSDRLRSTLAAVDQLAADPQTRGALDRLLTTVNTAVPFLRFVVPAQTVCNYLGLWTRNVPSTISEGDDSGTWFRTLVVAQTDESQSRSQPSPNLHVDPYGNSAAPGQTHECEVGNEPYTPGQHIGHAAGNQGTKTQDTPPPAEVRGK